MKKISDLKLSRLRNEEYVQFHCSFKNLVLIYTATGLKIEILFSQYSSQCSNVESALNNVRKSMLTDDLIEADSHRDDIFRGFCDAVKSGLNHFRTEIRQAAQRIQIVLDHYGNVAAKSYDAETAAINKLVTELTEHYANELQQLHLSDWVTELQERNTAYENLKNSKYTEESKRLQLQMRDERAKLDAIYRQITERINALIVVEGDTNYITFVNELNKRVEEHAHNLAIRRGRSSKDNEESK